jgi:hypothetical protein
MGLAQLHDLVLSTSAVKAFKGISNDLINIKDFWLHSVFVQLLLSFLHENAR